MGIEEAGPSRPLTGMRVLDLSLGVAGGYCTKLLADAGATVVKVEPPGGDPMRCWTWSGAISGEPLIEPGEDGVLFQYLHAGKRSVVIDNQLPEGRTRLQELAADADVAVEDLGPAAVEALGLSPDQLPRTSLVSISSFGAEGPWANRAATEFTLQAWAGSTAGRGQRDREPLAAGGRTGEWIAGAFAALSALAIWWRARRTGRAEQADVSILESLVLTHTVYQPLAASMGEARGRQMRSVEFPSIEKARDGWVGFCTVQARTWQDFCHLVGQSEWASDPELSTWVGRYRRLEELREKVSEWLSDRSVDEVLELGSAMRIAVAPIGNGARTPTFDHFVERQVFVPNPGGFVQPRPPFQMSATPAQPIRGAPQLDEHAAVGFGETSPDSGAQAEPVADILPLEGVRVADFTNAWAGSFGAQLLAMLGAEVIKVESTPRPDTARFGSVRPPTEDQWWEFAPIFHGTNTNKRDLTLDLGTEAGLELAKRLIAISDIVLENYSPRVMEQFGLGYDTVHALNPSAVMLRMPAFGLSGPWRDRIGYAQTIEQVSGLAWITGYEDGPPLIPRGLCDPLTGLHAVIAAFVGLAQRERTGEGQLIEVTMAEVALNISAEPILEYSKYGVVVERRGNRGPGAVPQDVYRCRGDEAWVAIAVENDDQWIKLRRALGSPDWTINEELKTVAGRRAAEDRIGEQLADWCSRRTPSEVLDVLWAAGVPTAEVTAAAAVHSNPQLISRQFFETLTHPLIGTHARHPGLPFKLSGGPRRWNRTPAPTLGQDNEAILKYLFGSSDDDIADLCAGDIIGDRPRGV